MEIEVNMNNLTEGFNALGDEVDRIISDGNTAKITITKKSNGTIPLLRLWRMWMQDIADHMAKQGRKMPLLMDKNGNYHGLRPFNADDAHEAYTHLTMGCDENGNRYSWCVKSDMYDGRVSAPLGMRLHAMDLVHRHAMEHGIILRMPKNTEYEELTKRTEQ